jgi:hypothetical protein
VQEYIKRASMINVSCTINTGTSQCTCGKNLLLGRVLSSEQNYQYERCKLISYTVTSFATSLYGVVARGQWCQPATHVQQAWCRGLLDVQCRVHSCRVAVVEEKTATLSNAPRSERGGVGNNRCRPRRCGDGHAIWLRRPSGRRRQRRQHDQRRRRREPAG